ncbi:MAG: alkylglycerol monooxygenase [Myxococcota bacterium]|jgi:alkylglycerol monooxygenase
MSEGQLLSIGFVLFAVLIGLEFAWSRKRRDGGYGLSQVVANIGHGALFQVFDGFTKALVIIPFLAVASLTPATLPVDSPWTWLVGLMAYDFQSYWRHRHHHQVGVLWAIHAVHHAASEFNFAAALRQALFQNLVAWIWALPLALFLPLEVILGIVVFDLLYQFLQHTRYVPKLGPLEWIFNTPSHHRVHHGTQPKYLDRNYGGIFIIWDRLFGTFQVEEEEPIVGLTTPFQDVNPLWDNLVFWRDLSRAAALAPSWRHRLQVLVGPPIHAERLLAPTRPAQPQVAKDNAGVRASRSGFAALIFAPVPLLLAALAWVSPEAVTTRVALGLLILGLAVASAALLPR